MDVWRNGQTQWSGQGIEDRVRPHAHRTTGDEYSPFFLAAAALAAIFSFFCSAANRCSNWSKHNHDTDSPGLFLTTLNNRLRL